MISTLETTSIPQQQNQSDLSSRLQQLIHKAEVALCLAAKRKSEANRLVRSLEELLYSDTMNPNHKECSETRRQFERADAVARIRRHEHHTALDAWCVLQNSQDIWDAIPKKMQRSVLSKAERALR